MPPTICLLPSFPTYGWCWCRQSRTHQKPSIYYWKSTAWALCNWGVSLRESILQFCWHFSKTFPLDFHQAMLPDFFTASNAHNWLNPESFSSWLASQYQVSSNFRQTILLSPTHLSRDSFRSITPRSSSPFIPSSPIPRSYTSFLISSHSIRRGEATGPGAFRVRVSHNMCYILQLSEHIHNFRLPVDDQF